MRAWVELLAPSVCPGCDAPRAPGRLLLCGACEADLHAFGGKLGVRTAIAYRGTGRILLRRFKFDGRGDARLPLVHFARRRLADLEFDVVLGVGRHRARILETGRDPAFELARAIARSLRRPFVASGLWRTRATEPQTRRSERDRRRDLAGSFGASPRALAGRCVLVVDDVVTTGTTLREATRVVASQGRAREVLPFAIAATDGPA